MDTEGFVLEAEVHSAKVMDWDGIQTLLQRADTQFPHLKHLWVDAGYRGEDKGKDWVERTLGWSVELVERPRKPAPKEVLMAWAEQWSHEGHATTSTSAFVPLLKRAALSPKDVTPHTLRHTCATLLLSQGTHSTLVHHLLGHATVSMTLDRYGHWVPSMGTATASAMDAALGL